MDVDRDNSIYAGLLGEPLKGADKTVSRLRRQRFLLPLQGEGWDGGCAVHIVSHCSIHLMPAIRKPWSVPDYSTPDYSTFADYSCWRTPGVPANLPGTVQLLVAHVEHYLLFYLAQPGLDFRCIPATHPHENFLAGRTRLKLGVGKLI